MVSFHYATEEEAVPDEELGDWADLFCPDHPFDPPIAEWRGSGDLRPRRPAAGVKGQARGAGGPRAVLAIVPPFPFPAEELGVEKRHHGLEAADRATPVGGVAKADFESVRCRGGAARYFSARPCVISKK